MRFLAFLFGLHPALVADLHIQIKQSMPGCSKDDILSYGEVYFRAWKMATDIYLEVHGMDTFLQIGKSVAVVYVLLVVQHACF